MTVVGDGPLRVQLRETASALQLRNTEFTGRLEHELAAKLYDTADVFLNGSSIDNQPLSILEAFACGLPVVSTNAGGIPFMVENEVNALLSPVGDERKLAENVLRLMEDQQLAGKLISNGLRECESSDWELLRDQWLNTYHSLAGSDSLPLESPVVISLECQTGKKSNNLVLMSCVLERVRMVRVWRTTLCTEPGSSAG